MVRLRESLGAVGTLTHHGRPFEAIDLGAVARAGFAAVASAPLAVRILLENMLRNEDGESAMPFSNGRSAPSGT